MELGRRTPSCVRSWFQVVVAVLSTVPARMYAQEHVPATAPPALGSVPFLCKINLFFLFIYFFSRFVLCNKPPTAHDKQLRERAGRPGAVELRRAGGGGDRGRLGRSLFREWSLCRLGGRRQHRTLYTLSGCCCSTRGGSLGPLVGFLEDYGGNGELFLRRASGWDITRVMSCRISAVRARIPPTETFSWPGN